MSNFHSDLKPPRRDLIFASCHAWFLKDYSQDEYVCVTCRATCIGAKNMGSAPKCKALIVPRNWLSTKDPHYTLESRGEKKR